MIDRRQFGKVTAAAVAMKGLTAAGERSCMKIDSIQIFPVRYPLTGYFKFFAGPGRTSSRAVVIVKITANDGTIGWGQSVPIAKWSYETLETATVALRDYYVPALIGREATDIAGAALAMDEAIAPAFSTGMPITRAGVDLAFHDLAGKLAGHSLAEMWGHNPGGSLTLSWTVNVAKLDDLDAVLEEGHRRGYRNFNIKVAPDPEFDVELARLVRRRAPDAFLWADANGGYHITSALQVAPRLAEVGVDVLEAPLRPNRLSG
jgi:L-alanine-DL-glutamate epimerase-like enolase superfamily enzyme